MTSDRALALAVASLEGRTERFTSSEIGVLRSRYPHTVGGDHRRLESGCIAAANTDHRRVAAGLPGVLIHYPDRRHPCARCRYEAEGARRKGVVAR